MKVSIPTICSTLFDLAWTYLVAGWICGALLILVPFGWDVPFTRDHVAFWFQALQTIFVCIGAVFGAVIIARQVRQWLHGLASILAARAPRRYGAGGLHRWRCWARRDS